MLEQTIKNLIRRKLGEDPTIRLFTNPSGVGYLGEASNARPGRVVIRNPRRILFGLCPGSSDLIGWKTVEITQEDVGKKVAVFTAIEVKTGSGRPTNEQQNFLDYVKSCGGYAGIARDADQAKEIFSG